VPFIEKLAVAEDSQPLQIVHLHWPGMLPVVVTKRCCARPIFYLAVCCLPHVFISWLLRSKFDVCALGVGLTALPTWPLFFCRPRQWKMNALLREVWPSFHEVCCLSRLSALKITIYPRIFFELQAEQMIAEIVCFSLYL